MRYNTAVQQHGTIEPLPLGQEGLVALMHGNLPPIQDGSGERQWLVLTELDGILGQVEAHDDLQARSAAKSNWPHWRGKLRVWNRADEAKNRARSERAFRKNRRGTAHHEAGHAVMAWHLGIPILRVQVGLLMYSDGDEFHPRSVTEGFFEMGDVEKVFEGLSASAVPKRKVRISVAGPMSDYRFRGRPDWTVINRRRLCFDDERIARRAAWDVAIEYCGCSDRRARGEDISRRHAKCVDRYIKQAGQEAGALLDAHWHQVESVANELVRVVEIRGEDFDRLMSGVPSIGSLGFLY